MDSDKKPVKLKIRRKKTSTDKTESIASLSSKSDTSSISIPKKRKLKIRRKKISAASKSKKLTDSIAETTQSSSDALSFLSSYIDTSADVTSKSSIASSVVSAAATPIMKLEGYSMNIIVPFRDNLILKSQQNQDRTQHLMEFKEYMTGTFLPEVKSQFRSNGIEAKITISIIEQSQDRQRFNRGALLNAGFLINSDFDVYIFHDVDLLPNDKMLSVYSTKYSRDSVIHFAGGWDRYSGESYIGGVTLIGNDIFQAINGFPNDYWGWGGEDDEIKRRLETLGLFSNLHKITIPDSFRDLENIKTAQEKRAILKTNIKNLDNVIKTEQAREHKITWNRNGINQHIISFYEIIDTYLEEISGINYQIFQIHLNYDKIKPNIDERVVRSDLYSTTDEESKTSQDDDEIMRSATGVIDGSSGYGDDELSEEAYQLSTAPEKYRHKFEYYFSTFPQALKETLQMDEAMTFSVTEANMANIISNKILELPGISSSSSIIDATAGAGGNSMSFMNNFKNVRSIELNTNRCKMLEHNLLSFNLHMGDNVKGEFEVICGSYSDNLKNTDIIFFDPPWGGIGYQKKSKVQLQLGGILMNQIANMVKDYTKYVVMKLPLNYNIDAIREGIQSNGGNLSYEIIKDDSDKPKMLLVYINYQSDVNTIETPISIDEFDKLFDLNKYPMSFNTLDDCKQNLNRLPVITNPLVFYNLLDSINLESFVKKVDTIESIEEDVHNGKYTLETIRNTFDYLFYKIKMGVFVMIKDNRLKYFIPFQNQHFINEWSSLIRFSDGISNIDEYAASRKEYIRDEINRDITTWEANNCVLGTWLGNDIGDMGWSEFRELLTELCENKSLNDCIFYYNRRDNPVLSNTRSEPYNHLYNSYTEPLKSHSYDTYIPILGYCNNNNFADQLIPTYADWRDITKKYYPTSCQNMNVSEINHNWNTKYPIAVFRGSATGCGVTPESNDRIGISLISKALRDRGNNGVLDAGLTGFNSRDKKMSGGPVSFFKYRDYGLEKADRISMNDQSNFKYIIHIDGHVSAYRLGKELSLGSTIIKIKSRGNYKVWFSDQLIKLEKDLSNKNTANYIELESPRNIIPMLQFLKSRDDIAESLARNALNLYNRLITRDNIFNYMENLINKVSKNYYL